jgi:thiamine kinase-like enzyme
MVDVTAEPVRVCPVDWEQAAIGSALYDLALISDGFEPPALDLFLDAYRQEAMEQSVPVPDREELRRVVTCFRLFMAINLLSRACQRKFSERKVAKIVDLLERLHRLVFADKVNT